MILILISMAALGAAALCAFVSWLLRGLRNVSAGVVEAPDEISLEGYQAFPRLMSGSDLAFLSMQPGYEPAIGRNLRRAHARTARLYLKAMRADFADLCRSARAMAASSMVDRSELVAAVERESLIFHWRLNCVRVRMALSSVGVGVPGFAGLAESLSRIRNAMAPPEYATRRV